MSNRPSPPAHVSRTRVDISLLQLTDRSCLRLLEHTRVATATQLAYLIYPSIRTALRRARKLHLQHLLTREPLPAERGGIPLAYRLSEAGRRRLHLNAYRSPGLVTLRHALDGVEFVASLVAFDPGLVQLWLTESHVPRFADDIHPDQLVVIDTGEASAILLVEVDESTERPPVIRERLEAYARLFDDGRTGWHLLWVVNSPERLARLRQYAGPTKTPTLAGRCWGVAIDDVSDYGADAEVIAVVGNAEARELRDLATDPRARLSNAPVGSEEWIRLLANGGQEALNGPWQGVEREPQGAPEAPQTAPVATPGANAVSPVNDPPEPARADVAPSVLVDVDADVEIMRPNELMALTLDPTATPRRANRAIELMVERENWYDLLDVFTALCRSADPDRRLDGVALVLRLHGSASAWLRRESRALLLELVDGSNGRAVVEAALAALELLGGGDEIEGPGAVSGRK
jgi:hypothetical protein